MTATSLLRTRIKFCGLTREADVDAAAEAGADAVGFVLYPGSLRYVSAQRAAELARRLPAFVTPVLLFVNAPPDAVATARALVPGAWVQFHGDETASDCALACSAAAGAYIKAARIPLDLGASAFDLLQFADIYSAAQAILLDAHVDEYGGAGKTFNWSLLPPNVSAHLVLSGGLTSANVGDGIRALRPRGKSLAVDVSSGVEALDASGRPIKGIKDPTRMRQFVAAVRAADAGFEIPTTPG